MRRIGRRHRLCARYTSKEAFPSRLVRGPRPRTAHRCNTFVGMRCHSFGDTVPRFGESFRLAQLGNMTRERSDIQPRAFAVPAHVVVLGYTRRVLRITRPEPAFLCTEVSSIYCFKYVDEISSQLVIVLKILISARPPCHAIRSARRVSCYSEPMSSMPKEPKKLHAIPRAIVEIGSIVFLFYSNLLMGEFTHANGRGKTFAFAIHDIFTLTNFGIASISGLIGYFVFEYLRKKL